MYGIRSLHEFLVKHNLYAGNHAALTEGEARLLIGAKTLDAARDRIAAEVARGNQHRQRGVLQETAGQDVTPNGLFQKAKRYDPNQLDLILGDIPSRPGEDTAQTRADRLGVATNALLRGADGSLLGLSLATDWIRGKGSDLIGKRVTYPKDLATLGAVSGNWGRNIRTMRRIPHIPCSSLTYRSARVPCSRSQQRMLRCLIEVPSADSGTPRLGSISFVQRQHKPRHISWRRAHVGTRRALTSGQANKKYSNFCSNFRHIATEPLRSVMFDSGSGTTLYSNQL